MNGPRMFRTILLLSIAGLLIAELPRLKGDEEDSSAASQTAVDFEKQVQPILAARCASCHAGSQHEGGFSINTRTSLLKGGESGETVVPNKASESLLIELVAGTDPDRVMPPKGKRLTDEQVAVLRTWIDQGLKWPPGFRFDRGGAERIKPRRPEIPAAAPRSRLTNPIDLLLQPYLQKRGVRTDVLVSDRLFARRVYLDLIGMLPPPVELAEYLADTRPEKRTILVGELLNNRRAYADHWLTFWNDALRNTYRGTGFIDGGRAQITGWLYQSLYENKPYNRFVHELVSPVPGSEGFVKGIVWRGVVNASQRQELQAAQNIGQVFMGTNLKCASCHNSFVNDWKLSDAYGLASVFAEKPLELYRCNKPTGKISEVRFIFPHLGKIDANAPREQRMRQLADLITSPENGRLTRTIVNRLWQKLLGRGLIEPVDEMDNPPWNRDLIDWLAVDLRDQNYDLKQTLIRICTSRAYQLPSVGAPNPNETEFTFRGPIVKRLSAEQFVDAMKTLTGNQRKASSDMLKRDGRGQGGQLLAIRDVWFSKERPSGGLSLDAAKWIWNDPDAAKNVPGGRLYFRKNFSFATKPTEASVAVSCDNEFTLFVNGKKITASKNWNEPVSVDLIPHLQEGENLIAVEAVNQPLPQTEKKDAPAETGPAGLIFFARGTQGDGTRWRFGSDATWLCSPIQIAGWETTNFDTQGWNHAIEVAQVNDAPWNLGTGLRAAIGLPHETIRASLATADPLTRALGRPNREQVMTTRDSWATMLQTLELTNGTTLDRLLQNGAASWLQRTADKGEPLIDAIYTTTLGRLPSDAERATAGELIGSPVTRDGVADLLWALTMLPEFQLIY